LCVESTLCAAALAAGVAAAVTLPSSRPLSAPAIIACLVAYAAAARVRLHVGAGSAVPTQLAFIPMLFVLPVGLVPIVVATALAVTTLWEVVFARWHVERLMTAVGDSAYVFAPVLIVALAGAPSSAGDHLWLVAGAVAGQCALDVALSTVREWIGRGIRPAVQLDVMRTVYGVDALLLPIAVVLADEAGRRPLILLALLPLSLLLAALARVRQRRLDDALQRLADVERERERVKIAIDRVGRSLGGSLDRDAMLDVALGTAVDAVGAEAGRARLTGSFHARTFEAVPHRPGATEAEVLLAVERAALAGKATVAGEGGWWAMGRPLGSRRVGAAGTIGALAVCRAERRFSRDEEELFSYLAAQTAASIDAIALHAHLEGRISTDELTGLANHRRFQEILQAEVERATNCGVSLSLVLFDLDGFRRINALHGHEAGDEVLRAVAGVLSDHCHITDEPARYGGEQLAVALAGRDIEAARALAEDVRADIAALRLQIGEATVRVRASAGIAELSGRVRSREALVLAAEAALEEAKHAGRDRTVGFSGRRETGPR
jgi:diguanylate cyclase (GGDEF)-like protein